MENIPKEWSIDPKGDERIIKWLNDGVDDPNYYNRYMGDHIDFPNRKDGKGFKHSFHLGGTEGRYTYITHEQFFKYVLKEELFEIF